jgi:hypothetical protein
MQKNISHLPSAQIINTQLLHILIYIYTYDIHNIYIERHRKVVETPVCLLQKFKTQLLYK